MPLQPKKPKKVHIPIVIDEDDDEEFAIVPPDGGWGWVVVIGAFYLNTVIDGIFFTFSVFLQDLADDFGAEKSTVSWVFSILFGTHYGMGVVCAGLSNAFGLRPVTCAGAILAAFAFGISSVVRTAEVLYFTYGLLGGTGLGLMITNGVIAPTIYFSKWRGLAIAITSMGTGIGTVVFPYIGNHIRKIASWQTAFQFQAVAVASIFLAGLTFRPIKPSRVVKTEDMDIDLMERRSTKISRGSVSTKSDTEPREIVRGPVRVPTVFIKKTLYDTTKSMMSFNIPTQVAETMGAQTIYHRFARQQQPGFMARWCKICKKAVAKPKPRRQRSTENVLFVRSDVKNDLFWEDEGATSRKGAVASRVGQVKSKFLSTMSLEPSAFVYSKISPPPEKNPCEPLIESVRGMLDCKVFKSPAFAVYVLCGFGTLFGLIIVTAYQPDRAQMQGFDGDTATYFVMTYGAANSVWRLILGILSVMPKANNLSACVLCTMVGGIAVLVSGLNVTLWFQYFWAVAAGLAMASFAVHRPVILVDLVGLDKVTGATGIQYMLMGVAAILGPPLSGLVMEASDNYDAPFYMSGTFLTTSGFVMSVVGFIKRREKKANEEDSEPDLRLML